MKNSSYLIVISGTTAIGKTRLAIELAQYFDTEILSADSRQFYKEMSIGTAVPSKEELNTAVHHFIQHKSIFDKYSVGDFEREAIFLLNQLFQHKNILILVGGSGLYSSAILNGLDDFPEVPISIREQLTIDYQSNGIEFLQQKLKEIDPIQYQQMDINNPQRMLRALEVSIASGQPYSSFLQKKQITRNFIPIEIGLTAEREIIYNRINQRVDIMMQEGLLKEIQRLYPYKDLNALQTVGYRELFDFIDQKYNLNTAIEQIKMNTRRFAKRQQTWFHKNKNIQWFDYKYNISEIINHIEKSI